MRTRLVAACLGILLALGDFSAGLAAGPAEPAKEPAPPKIGTSVFDAVVRSKWTGDFDGMLKRRYLRVLVVSSRTLYFVDRGQQRGLTYDVFKFVEDEINKKTGKQKFHVVFIPVARDQLLPRLVEGYGDVAAASLTITPERQKLVDFSAPAFRDVSELVVTGPRSPAIASTDDLSGQEVFVRASSSYAESLRALNERLAAEGKPPAILKPAPEDLEDEDLLEMVNAGLVGIVIVDSHIARFWTQVFPDIRVHEDVAVRTGGEIAWAIRKGSPLLKERLDSFLGAHGLGKTFGNVLLKRYLTSAHYVKSASSEAEFRKFRQVVDFFEKYGGRYDMDPLLLAAQGYQESRLDQNVRSKVGAIGVMQVMPSTGKELGVGDITKTEPNVHAGVKYIRSMIDRYYSSEDMDPLNRGLFAFASYNAGPARIQKLRAEAAKRGLDPNVWFNNVAIVALEKIGREPVQYVANIYKYYIAYKLIEEARAAREAAKKSLAK